MALYPLPEAQCQENTTAAMVRCCQSEELFYFGRHWAQSELQGQRAHSLPPSEISRLDSALSAATSLQGLSKVVANRFHVSATTVTNPAPSTSDPLSKLCDYGLERADAIILKAASEKVLSGRHLSETISVSSLIAELQAEGIRDEDVLDSVEHLRNKSFIKATGGRFSRFIQLSIGGFDAYLRCFYKEYDRHYWEVISAIVKDGLTTDSEVSGHLGLPRPLVSHFFSVLERGRLCQMSHTNMGARITHVSVELRRQVAGHLNSPIV
jgi:hypothetical protein